MSSQGYSSRKIEQHSPLTSQAESKVANERRRTKYKSDWMHVLNMQNAHNEAIEFEEFADIQFKDKLPMIIIDFCMLFTHRI